MTLENLSNGTGLVEVVSSLPGISTLIKIGQVAAVVVICYNGFLIFKGILQMKQTKKITKLAEDVEKIDKKLDKILKSKK